MPLPEKALIAGIRKRAVARPWVTSRSISKGIGDDCAVLRVPRGREILVTTDFSLEGIHFRRDWHPAESIGHRCLARGLSDIAAMGGDAVSVFLSLALPKDIKQGWVNRFISGLLALARRFEVPLAGGDTAQSAQGIIADIVVVGSVPAGRALFRSGARIGDKIYVTGSLGSSAAALHLLRGGKKLVPRNYPAHFYPVPRLHVAPALRSLASSMIDVSDGLSTDLGHICEESGVGAEIVSERIPRKPGVSLEDALHGGEDYELLFTAPPRKHIPNKIAGIEIAEIGRITRGKKMLMLAGKIRKTLIPQGWQHF